MRRPWRQQLFVAIALAVVGLVVVGGVLVAARREDRPQFATAELVPSTASLYISLNTDLKHKQWSTAFRLVQRLGIEDPEARLRELVEDEDVDWEHEVAPFLGGDAAFFVTAIDLERPELVQGAAIVRCADPARELAVLDKRAGPFERERYEGVEYLYNDALHLYVARLDDFLVLGTDRRALLEVIDVHHGRQQSLASLDGYKRLLKELPTGALAFTYLDAQQLVKNIQGGDDFVRGALEQALAGAGAASASVMTLRARDGAFEVRALTPTSTGAAQTWVTPQRSRFATLVPEDTVVFVSTHGIGEAWSELSEADRDGATSMLNLGALGGAEMLPFFALPDFSDVAELLAVLRGELAVALAFPSAQLADPGVLVLAEVRDESVARRALEKLAGFTTATRPRAQRVGNFEVFTASSGGVDYSYAVTGGYVAIGTPERVRVLLERRMKPLADHPDYQAALLELPDPTGSFAYADLRTLIGFARGEFAPPELLRAADALRGLVLNAVAQNGTSRFSGSLLIED